MWVAGRPFTPDDTPPAAPQGLVATAGEGLVSLTWAANTEPDLAGYNVYRDGAKVNGPLVTAAAYVDTGLTNGQTYAYTVTAVDFGGLESDPSDEASATPMNAAPSLSIDATPVTEGNCGTTQAVFNVTLSAPSVRTVRVAYATTNGSAEAGSDYDVATPLDATLTFLPGVVSQPVLITINGDPTFESAETFTVNLSSPSEATIGNGTATGTILNDDIELHGLEELVTWTRMVGVSVCGADIRKTAVTGWNAGAVSTKAIMSGDGHVEFAVGGTLPVQWVAGLGHGDTDQSYQDIEYGVYGYQGYAYVFESGVYRGGFSSYAIGDRFQVAVEGTVVKYRQNGVEFYQSTVPVTAASYPLLLDTALFLNGTAIGNAVISGATLADVWTLPSQDVVWTRDVGVSVSGSSLTKTAGMGGTRERCRRRGLRPGTATWSSRHRARPGTGWRVWATATRICRTRTSTTRSTCTTATCTSTRMGSTGAASRATAAGIGSRSRWKGRS